MVIGLFGASCTGKTTLARMLAARTGADLRCCGDIVRREAEAKGVQFSDLSLRDHQVIDSATTTWVQGTGERIVEGRFLDQVLHGAAARDGLVLIEIVAKETARAERWASRLGRPQALADVQKYDEEDASFRVQAYGATARLTTNWTVDTTNRSADECLEEIARYLSTRSRPG